MIQGLKISMYRRFESLRVEGLTSVNLIVGENNSGKTTLLEAVHLLASGGDPAVYLQTIRRRDELMFGYDDDADRPRHEWDPRFTFHNRDFQPGSRFEITSTNGQPEHVSCSLVPFPKGSDGPELPFDEDEYTTIRNAIVLERSHSGDPAVLPLSHVGGLTRGSVSRHMRRYPIGGEPQPVFVSSQSLGTASMTSVWDEVVLTPEEDEVIHALRIIEPRIERIAFQSLPTDRLRMQTAGIVLKMRDSDERIPLGTMGDGVRRLLALALAVAKSKDSVLLVDEIDTGLHYSVMASMWKMVIESAARNNTQVFATTHSQDCLSSLAWLCDDEPQVVSQVSLQRLTKGADRAVQYSAQELASVVQRRIEVR